MKEQSADKPEIKNNGPFPSSVFPKEIFPRSIFPWMVDDDDDETEESTESERS